MPPGNRAQDCTQGLCLPHFTARYVQPWRLSCRLSWRRQRTLWWWGLLPAAPSCPHTPSRCALRCPWIGMRQGPWLRATAAPSPPSHTSRALCIRLVGPPCAWRQFMHWTDAFTSKLGKRTKLVGSGLTCEGAPKGGDAGEACRQAVSPLVLALACVLLILSLLPWGAHRCRAFRGQGQVSPALHAFTRCPSPHLSTRCCCLPAAAAEEWRLNPFVMPHAWATDKASTGRCGQRFRKLSTLHESVAWGNSVLDCAARASQWRQCILTVRLCALSLCCCPGCRRGGR